MPTTYNTINYYVAADGTLRDGAQGEIPQRPQLNYGTEYAVTLAFPAGTIAEGDQLQVALNRTRTFFSSASATGDAPVAAVAKHDVTAEEAAAQAVTLTLSTATRAMIDQVNGIDHPVRGFFGVHVLRGQSFVTLAVADALMMSLESGPDAISPSLPVVDYPTREEAVAYVERSETAAGNAEEAQGKAEEAEANAQIWAEGNDAKVEAIGGEHSAKEYARLAGNSETNAGQSATDAGEAKTAAETAQDKAEDAQEAAETAQSNATKIAEGSDADVTPLGLEHSAKGWADVAEATLDGKQDILQTLVSSSSTALEVEAGKSYMWTVSAASTISMAVADRMANKETRIDVYVDLQSGGSVAGSGVTIADAVLQSGWYKLIWDGTAAVLYSTKAGGAESYIVIPAATTAYALADNKHYQQVPDAVPTYTLPAVTADGLVHEITILVDFLHVTSCAFVDAGGMPVTLQAAISPVLGSAYVFHCYWYGKWRIVPTLIRSAATVTSSFGALSVGDAVAGDALALRMTAPRSVVVNQLVQNGDFSDGTTRWAQYLATLSAASNVLTATLTIDNSTKMYFNVLQNLAQDIPAGRAVLVRLDIKCPYAGSIRVLFQNGEGGAPTFGIFEGVSYAADTWTTVSIRCRASSMTDVARRLLIYPIYGGYNSWTVGDVAQLRNIQLIDLTQYFNGDTTLINSIQSWDDLVAYDPRFAQYVAYNAGEVVGAQPEVKVTGKNLYNFDDGSVMETSPGFMRYANLYKISRNEQTNFVLSYQSTTSLVSGVFLYKFKRGAEYTSPIQMVSSPVSITVPAGYDLIVLWGAVNKTSAQSLMTQYGISNIQLELGSSATAYEPYRNGGTAQAPADMFAVGNAADEFEAVSGVTTRKMGSVDLGTLDWIYDSGYATPIFSAVLANSKRYNINMVLAGYVAKSGFWENAGNDKCIATGGSKLNISNSAYTTAAAFKTAVSGQYLYYELATPTTSTSTPAQISLQAGNNTAMQTDGGRTLADLSLTYENLPAAN